MKLVKIIECITLDKLFDDGLFNRRDLPQIKIDSTFFNFLDCNDINYKIIQIPTNILRPSQNEYNEDKILNLLSNKKFCDYPLVISSDRYVIDGHHRYGASYLHNPTGKLVCCMLDKSIKDFLDLI